jgi:hypothetical protein
MTRSRHPLASLTVVPFALVAMVATTGCAGEYYANGGAATSYGQSGVVYNGASANTSAQPIVDEDGNVVGYTNPQPQPQAGQEVYIGADADDYVDTDPSALTEFRATLDPYGTWYDDASYGTVWVPSPTVVGADFAPYVTSGHWVYSDDYVWVSDYDWGWAPFHYGRWVYITGRGWAWIPGRRYAGAWVSWRVGNAGYGYVGWGPLAPTWYWRSGVAVGLSYYPPTPYTFCSTGDLFHPAIAARTVAGPAVQAIAAQRRPWTPAQPTTGGRTPASPTVQPGPAGRMMLGPPPSALGIQPQAVVPPPPSDRGLLRAQQFSRPATAVAVGARAPQLFPGPTGPTPIDARPRLPTTVVQGGPQAYTRPPQPLSPPPTYQQPQVYQRPPQPMSPPPTAYQPAPTWGNGATASAPPPTYVRPASPPPSYSPPPTYQQPQVYRAPSPPPVYMQRPSAPPAAPPPVVRAAPMGGGGSAPPAGGAMMRRR